MTAQAVPGYVVGTWIINPENSDISFVVRHLGVTKVHGRFNDVTGQVMTGESSAQSSVTATINADSIDTGFPARDDFIKSDDVLAVAKHKELRFTSSGIRSANGEFLVDGELTIRGTSRPVTLTVDVGGIAEDPVEKRTVLGMSVTTSIKRADFGISPSLPSFVIGDTIDIHLDIQASLGS
jgi:polyisoprenoid-binding protein YceI